MNSKIKKVLFIIGAILLVAIMVLYAIFPNQTKEIANNVWQFLNDPLPVVGVSLFIIGGFVLKILYGKGKIKSLEERYKAKYDELQAEKDEIRHFKEEIVDLVNENKDTIVNACLTIPNIKVNKLGEELKNGKREETIDNNWKAKKV